MRYILDAFKMQDKEKAHLYLKEVLGLPEYYGGNLDALYDVLSECDEIEVEFVNMTQDNEYAQKVQRVFKAAGVDVI